MILLTGAGGKTGQAIAQALHAADQPVRAWLRHPHQSPHLPAAERISGDLLDPSCWRAACAGVQAVYLICPNMHPQELAIVRLALDAATGAGVQRLVYHSVLHPQTQEMAHHWQKLRAEEEIFRRGLAFTILQPCAYMQNFLAYRTQILADGRFAVPYDIHTPFGFVDLADVAQAAARVLTEAGHAHAIYELAGPRNLSCQDAAAALAAALHRPIEAIQSPLDVWEQSARAAGLSAYATDALGAMFRYYDRHGLPSNGNVLGWLLGRSPTPFSRFARRTFQEQ